MCLIWHLASEFPLHHHLTIMVDDDDFEEVEREAQQYAKQILHAILKQPDGIPADVPIAKRSAWQDRQEIALEECQKLM